ncbi:MAG: N-acetylmuramic acid 6-phosphate etherase [Marinilabiliales bacterium]|nr:MAG: N-acetylmuramic acid 6-phosphate etherase [Marinilabiliales bacterium]
MKTTELSSLYDHLEQMNTEELLHNINQEDQKVAHAITPQIPNIKQVIDVIVDKLKDGGRLFYIGSGTSGRLGIVDASECPPTFGVSDKMVIGIIAGGDNAIRKAIEKAEDDVDAGWDDLKKYNVSSKDFIIGISASGTTPYVVGALQHCTKNNIKTACICCNKKSPMAAEAWTAIEVIVGPEFVTGSTRMKAGTAQKMVLNMISTSVMIKLGKVVGNKMVYMQLNNEKLIERGSVMISEQLNIEKDKARQLLLKYGSVRNVINQNIQ